MSRCVPAGTLNRRPTVSVVVPCYNYARYLVECVETVLSQEDVDPEVIIVDDASTDASATVAEALATADNRVRVIRHPTNRGHIATYNDGLAEATGDYVVLLSADDLLLPGSLARATALLDANPSVGMVYGHPTHLYEGTKPKPPRTRVRNWTIWSGPEWIRLRCRAGINCIFNPEVVLRTSVQREIGGYRSDLPHSGDLEMWMRAASVADVGRVNGADQAYYRVHAASMQRTVYAGHLTDLQARWDAFRVVLTEHAEGIPGSGEMLATVQRTLANEALGQISRIYSDGREDPDADLVDSYLQFARELYPDTPALSAWRTIPVARRTGEHRSAVAALNAYRTIEDKIRWRRWRWNGV
ncbi:glycosyltransferase family 2 protein [Protofrankia symbiont of Coriaria ruscifolia]|uniref:glycosyltransferase family 2 protein n=1 Tax=Protofrankia symbiont of Coriaria ruscifolia TaxID=1306542 RepID=UPI0010416408|nr:glycosyltransferase [Protofrankia symbiont of Coriaria ruscifolia]